MNRFDINNITEKKTLEFSLTNMVTKEPKSVNLTVGDKVSILYANNAEDILQPGPRTNMIFRGKVIDITAVPERLYNQEESGCKVYIIDLDCSSNFESKMVKLFSRSIIDINNVDYIYEQDDPEVVAGIFSVLVADYAGKFTDVYSSHIISGGSHSRTTSDNKGE